MYWHIVFWWRPTLGVTPHVHASHAGPHAPWNCKDYTIDAKSSNSWKSLYEDLQAKLLLRLRDDKSFCRRPTLWSTECQFCQHHREDLEAAGASAGANSSGSAS